MPNKCIFCDLVKALKKNKVHKEFKNQFICQTKYWMLILDRDPYVKGHMLLMLKRHAHYFQIDDDETKDMKKAFQEAKARLDRLDPRPSPRDIINILAMNDNQKFHDDEGRPHFHFHIIPRYPYSILNHKHHELLYGNSDDNAEPPDFGIWWLASQEKIRNDRKKGRALLDKMVSDAFAQMK